MRDPQQSLRALFEAAVAAVHPARCLPGHIPDPARGRTVVIGAGKAAAAMARVFEQLYPVPVAGLVVVPDAHDLATEHIAVLTAGHPVPDTRSVSASRRLLGLVMNLQERDRVVCLLSGGGSALLCLPPDEIPLDEKQAVTAALLKSGAPISEINCVRKHLSLVKGGRMAAACYPASCLTLAISDVPGDDLAMVASGPTVGDATTRREARAVLENYGLTTFTASMNWLCSARSESPGPADPRLARSEIHCLAKSADALAAAAHEAKALGIDASIVGDNLQGEARAVARADAARIRTIIADESKPANPRVLLSGGETTVTVQGQGRGGRNSEYLLALGISLAGQPGVYALACDTDGIDGSARNAGAALDPGTLARAAAMGLDARIYLDDNDAFAFFDALGALVVTGPTFTNVNDFRAIMLMPEAWDFKHGARL